VTAFELERLTSVEVAEIASQPTTVGLLPLGSIEQHGPHLPLATDLYLAQHLARRVGERSAFPVLIAPGIPGGRSDHHLQFRGTISLPAPTFAAMVRIQVEALCALGVHKVALISGHGGNFEDAAHLATSLGHSNHPALRVRAYSDFERFVRVMSEAAVEAGLHPAPTDVHAGVIETSMALYLFPDLVRPFDTVTGYVVPEDGWLQSMHAKGVRSLSPTGVLGDPRGANHRAGERIINALVLELASWIDGVFSEVPV
jgi:creatinine amidohydrolase